MNVKRFLIDILGDVTENCKTGVVWNPWQKARIDLEEQDYQRFVCVETGNIAFDLVQVPQGGRPSLLTSYTILGGLTFRVRRKIRSYSIK